MELPTLVVRGSIDVAHRRTVQASAMIRRGRPGDDVRLAPTIREPLLRNAADPHKTLARQDAGVAQG